MIKKTSQGIINKDVCSKKYFTRGELRFDKIFSTSIHSLSQKTDELLCQADKEVRSTSVNLERRNVYLGVIISI